MRIIQKLAKDMGYGMRRLIVAKTGSKKRIATLDWRKNEVWQKYFPGQDPKSMPKPPVIEAWEKFAGGDPIEGMTLDDLDREIISVYRARVPLRVPRPGESFPGLASGEKIPLDLWEYCLDVLREYREIGPKWVGAGRPRSGPISDAFEKADKKYQEMMNVIWDKKSPQQGRDWARVNKEMERLGVARVAGLQEMPYTVRNLKKFIKAQEPFRIFGTGAGYSDTLEYEMTSENMKKYAEKGKLDIVMNNIILQMKSEQQFPMVKGRKYMITPNTGS